jgi:hypothetical protein
MDASSMMIFPLMGHVCTRVPDLQLRAGVIVGVDQSCPSENNLPYVRNHL